MKKVVLVLVTFVMIVINGTVMAEPIMHEVDKTLGPTNATIGDKFLPAVLVPRVSDEATTGSPSQASTSTTLRIAPYQGYVDSMSHQLGVDTLNLGLKGKVTLYMTGVAMTEPAVLAGLQSANDFSNAQLERSINTYNLVTNAAKDSGSLASVQLLSELSACITEKSTANKTHDVGLLVDVCMAKAAPKESEQIETPARRSDNDGAGINRLFTGN